MAILFDLISIFFRFCLKDKDVADLEELVSPHRIPAEPPVNVDQGELNLEKELAALDVIPSQLPAQTEQHGGTVVSTDPEDSQQGSAAQPQKVIIISGGLE